MWPTLPRCPADDDFPAPLRALGKAVIAKRRTIWLADDEWQALASLASQAGTNASQYIRTKLLDQTLTSSALQRAAAVAMTGRDFEALGRSRTELMAGEAGPEEAIIDGSFGTGRPAPKPPKRQR